VREENGFPPAFVVPSSPGPRACRPHGASPDDDRPTKAGERIKSEITSPRLADSYDVIIFAAQKVFDNRIAVEPQRAAVAVQKQSFDIMHGEGALT